MSGASGSTWTGRTAAGACWTSASAIASETSPTYDSFAIDPHKWLAAPVGTGAAIVRDVGVLGRAFEIETGAYDQERHVPVGPGDTGSPFDELGLGTPDFGVDFSTPARGLAVWAILREIGAVGVRERIVRHDDCARPGRGAGADLGRAGAACGAGPVASRASATGRSGWERRGAPRRAQRRRSCAGSVRAGEP